MSHGTYYWIPMDRLDVTTPCITRAESCRKGCYRAVVTQTSGNILWTVEMAEKPHTLLASGPVLAGWMDQPDGFQIAKEFALNALRVALVREAIS